MSWAEVRRLENMILPAGFNNFNRTIFTYNTEITCTTESTMAVEFILAKFIAPETGTYKYTLDSMNLDDLTKPMIKLHSASFLGVRTLYGSAAQYRPETSFKQYLESAIGALSASFFNSTSTPESAVVKVFEISDLTTYTNNTIYFPANKGQAMVFTTDNVRSNPVKIKNQKITY